MVKRRGSRSGPEAAPERGDLVWLQFNPQAGHEQAGRRPALVVSPGVYNARVGLALCCPVTSHVKGYPFEVILPDDGPVTGAVLADQIKSLDWRVRQAEIIGPAPTDVIAGVLARIATLVNDES